VAPQQPAAYHELGRLTKAMAHPTRLRILRILGAGEACVCHLTTITGQRQAYISQHLMVLREAGLVTDRREGQMVYYRLLDRDITKALTALEHVLRATGIDVQFPPVPEAPIAGCPCPHCEAA